jgi:hypothetical protein
MKICVFCFNILVLLSVSFIAYTASNQTEQLKELDEYLNDTDNGSDFDQAVMLADTCDYTKCQSDECVVDVFKKTVFEEECAYVTKHFGKIKEDWDVVGFDAIEAQVFLEDKYYDDLGIEVFATGEKKVIRFNITSPIDGLKKKLGDTWRKYIPQ